MKSSNVVISCVGSHVWANTENEFEDSNIRVPMAIAKAAKNNRHVKRFIYISAAGAEPNSHSIRLRTKYIGEQEVKAIFPEVTILRPTCIMNTFEKNPTVAGKWNMQMKMFNRMNWLPAGINSTVQPVFANDIALAVLNCLKMEETIGQTYELGGPHTYTFEEIYEMFFSITEIKPYTNLVPLEKVYEYYHANRWISPYRYLFNAWLYPEIMTQEAQHLVVKPGSKGFDDLHIKPISFGTKVHEMVDDVYWLYNSHEVNRREGANN